MTTTSALETTSTSTQGAYQFTNLTQGSYYIQFDYPIYYLPGKVWNGDPETPNVQNSVNPENGNTNCFSLEDGGVFVADVGFVYNSNPNPVPVVTSSAPTVGVTTASPTAGVTTASPTAGVTTASPTIAVTVSPPTVGVTLPPTVAVTTTLLPPSGVSTTDPTTSTVAATAPPTTVLADDTVTTTSSPTPQQSILNTTACLFCQDGIPDPMVTISTGQTCGSVKLISADHMNGSEICKIIQEGEAVCCPKPIDNACTFCPGGIPDEDFMLETAGGISCGEVQALAAKETAGTVICSILKQPESLCCPSPLDSPSCLFCDDGMPDPDYVVPGTKQTCSEMKALAGNEGNETLLCGAIQLVEGSCCPELPVTNTTLSPTKMPTPSPTSQLLGGPIFAPPTSSQPTPEYTMRICTFCEEGMIDASLEIPGTEGRTCGSQKDRTENLNGLTTLCRTIQAAEDVCCPEPIANACSFCEEGIDNLDLELPKSEGRTCGTVNALAATMEEGSELCTTLKQAESECCPLPAGLCTFCQEGIPDPSIVMSSGQSCGSMQAAVASVQSDNDLCSQIKAVESQCCPVSVPPTNPTVASTKPPTVDVSSPIFSPSPSDYLVGPVTRSGIEMLMVGVENTEKVTVWQDETAAFIVDYFKKNPGVVYDVDVNVTVMFQTGTTAVESPFPRGPIRRKLQDTSTPSVIITYVQTSTYKSKYPNSYVYDEDYIAMKPFEEDSDLYITMLQNVSSYYYPVSEVTVTVPSPTPPPTPQFPASVIMSPEASGNASDSNTKYVIIGVACGVVLIAVLAGVLIVRKRKRVNQDIAPQTRQIETDEDLESRDIINAFDSKGALDAALSNLTTCEVIPSGSEGMVHVIAPEGKLGIVVATSPQGGPAYVSDLRQESPLLGKIRPGDKIIAIDDDDVKQLPPIEISKLIARKSKNPQRKFTIMRGEDQEQEQVPSSDENNESSVVTLPASPGTNGEHTVTIIAPKGKLGVVIQNHDGGGSPYVSELREGSVLEGQIHVNDKIFSIDDEDVRELKAFHISKILASKHQNSARKIVVLRGTDE